MGVEAIGSVSALQTKQVQKVSDYKTAADNKEVSVPENSANVDNATVTVARTETKNQKQGSDERERQSANNEKIKKAVEQLNKNLSNSEAIYGIHEESNRVTIKIIDKDSKEVIKELPPEKTLDMIAKVWELAGMLVDEKR